MIVEGSSLESGTTTEHDICVVGSGIAGVLLATELGKQGHDVCLVESGSMSPDNETQKLYDLENIGQPIRENFQSRLRHFGGSCNIWAGRAMVYQPVDMQTRPWASLSGWPFSLNELDSYYDRAAKVMKLPAYERFNYDHWSKKVGPFESGMIQNENFKPVVVMFAKSPARFGHKTRHHKQIDKSKKITAYTWSNVVDLRLSDQHDQVDEVKIACLNGVKFSIKAKRVILACGGLENTRILLSANHQLPDGIGNQNGMLGRGYMDHPRAVHGTVKLTKKISLNHTLGLPVSGGKMQLAYGLDNELQEKEELLNSYLSLEPNYSSFVRDFYKGFIKLMKRLLRKGYSGKRLDFKKEQVADVPEMIYLLTPKEILPHSVYYTYYKLSRIARKFVSKLTHLTIVSYSDQDLLTDSRVYLGEEKDKLGMRKLVLDWKISERSLKSSLRLIQLLDEHLKKHDLGYVEDGVNELKELPFTDASHHIGTTRMSIDPAEGVVDPDCKVHGIKNLYVAGSSVFPTAGHANPTFTIAAMALRLADHLNGQSA